MQAQKARQEAAAAAAAATTRTRMQPAGEFGEKRLLVKLEELSRDHPVDIVKRALEGAPSVMTFELTSTEQAGILPFLAELRALIAENELVLSSESTL
jgi:hypothetical protein